MRIAAIEARARRIGFSLLGLCADAGVPYATVHRWKHEHTQPLEGTAARHLGRLERKLDDHERVLVRILSAEATARAKPGTAA